METLKRKYGLLTGIAMVVGIVIGSGVFFKAPVVLQNTGGKLGQSLLAWGTAGLVMVISAFCFAIMATRVQKVNGVVDYIEVASNKKTGYAMGWYFSAVYYPILVATLGFVTMGYLYTLCGFEGQIEAWHFWLATAGLVTLAFVLNGIAPKIAGYFQVSTTVIKLIPIFFIAIVGSLMGLLNGNTAEAFKSVGIGAGIKNDFGGAILATIFAYEGWVVATSINAEIKNAKRNLPIALVIGTIIVLLCYLLYYIGLSSLMPNTNDIIESGNNAPIKALNDVFGIGEFVFNLLVLISCMGTLNGLTMGCSRGMYSLAYRNQGIAPEVVKKIHPKYNSSLWSCLIGFILSLIFVAIWMVSFKTKFIYLLTIDELVIAFVYPTYILIYIWIMKNCKDLKAFSRYIMPGLAILCSIFYVFVATGLFTLLLSKDVTRVISFAIFSGIVAIFMLVGLFNYRKQN